MYAIRSYYVSIQHCRQLFNPLFNEYKIDALISGHTHKPGILLPDENHLYPIIIGGGNEKTTEESEYNAAVISLTAEPNLLDINIYDYAGRKIARITSYNVCYTKLLRLMVCQKIM